MMAKDKPLSFFFFFFFFSFFLSFSPSSSPFLLLFFLLFLLLILQSLDWLAALHLKILQAIVFIVVQLSALVFLTTCFKYCIRGLPTDFFPDIAPSNSNRFQSNR
jgi:hypothetical protein